jgi:3-deoxy-D-manno-octulosonic-acid transferase
MSRAVRPTRRALPPRVARWGADALYGVLVVVLVPYALARAATDAKTRARWIAYLRDVPARFRRRVPRASDAPCVWVHGVSVGEVKAGAQLVERIEREAPGVEVVLSVSTGTARRVALDRYRGRRVDFYPPDLSWIVRDALDALRPDLIVLVESGFWPNLLATARARGVPVVVVNGKISERSRRRFQRAAPLARRMLRSLACLCVQTESYAERFRALGVDAARVHVTGNMKLDNVPAGGDEVRRSVFARILSEGPRVPVLVAGSTHPGEERAIAGIVARQNARGRRLRLVVAPRHPERADGAVADIRREGLAVVRRSALQGDAVAGADDVVLLDTVGELESLYAIADFVFVGGTLVPHGGQNMMEPASLGKPVVVGPHVHNFRGEMEMLADADAVARAADAADVERVLARWLDAPDEARALGARARETVLASKGATQRTLEVLRPWLPRALG